MAAIPVISPSLEYIPLKMVSRQTIAGKRSIKAKIFLPVSIKGVKDGDYAMIYGYPSGTNRYETSYGIKLKMKLKILL